MKFVVAPRVFEDFPTACFGVVVARGLDLSLDGGRAVSLLEVAARQAIDRFGERPVRDHPYIAAWRETFRRMGLNPNRYPSSIEAISNRIVKTGRVPSINPVVDLANAVALRYLLPVGAHDLGRMTGDIELRPAVEGDRFIPFGSEASEGVDAGEIVYADSVEVRTRRWVWRQGERAKITARTTEVFFPIDGFSDLNLEAVLSARDDLARYVWELLGGQVQKHFVDRAQPEVVL